jgi:hypothetical protein
MTTGGSKAMAGKRAGGKQPRVERTREAPSAGNRPAAFPMSLQIGISLFLQAITSRAGDGAFVEQMI